MKEIPILFGSEMVAAIIAGRKTMTRRTTKDNCKELVAYQYVANNPIYPENWKGKKSEPYTGWVAKFSNLPVAMPRSCPYGEAGDILFVRESWKLSGWSFEDAEATIEYADGTKFSLPISITDSYGEKYESEEWLINKVEKLVGKGFFQPADEPEDEEDEILIRTEKPYPFSPGIHLPKWGSRIWLEVTDIRAERLLDITEQDAVKEGVQENICEDPSKCPAYKKENGCCGKGQYFRYPIDYDAEPCYSAVESFETLWKSINGDNSWEENPWVWAVSFKVLSMNGKPCQ
jgi:hypothetical protein